MADNDKRGYNDGTNFGSNSNNNTSDKPDEGSVDAQPQDAGLREVALLPITIGKVLAGFAGQAATSTGEESKKAAGSLNSLLNNLGFLLQGLSGFAPSKVLKQLSNVIARSRNFIREAAEVMFNWVFDMTVTAFTAEEEPAIQLAANLVLVGFWILLSIPTLGLGLIMVAIHLLFFVMVFISMTLYNAGVTISGLIPR